MSYYERLSLLKERTCSNIIYHKQNVLKGEIKEIKGESIFTTLSLKIRNKNEKIIRIKRFYENENII